MKENKINFMIYIPIECADFCRNVWKGEASEKITQFIKSCMLEEPEKKEEYELLIKEEQKYTIELTKTRIKKQALETEAKQKQAAEQKNREIETNRRIKGIKESGFLKKLGGMENE